jgi:mannose-1-phosphate guanylyltransferase
MPDLLRPGTICRARGAPERLLLVEAAGEGRFRAAAYPLDASRPLVEVEACRLSVEGEDPASARVLALRARSLAAAAPARQGRPLRSAMVLCAGLGLRLRPLTLRYPKPALPFFEGPLVRYSFALLAGAGVRRVVINTHHLADVMAQVARREAARHSLDLEISHEPIIQGTGGGVREARRLLGDEPFVLLNGDSFMALDLAALVAEHQACGNAATLAVVPMLSGESFGAIEASSDGAVRGVAPAGRFTHGLEPNRPAEGRSSGGPLVRGLEPNRPAEGRSSSGPLVRGLEPWHFVGAHVIEPSVFDCIPASGEQDILRAVYPAMASRGLRVGICPVALGAWADLGTPRRYLQAIQDLLTGLCDLRSLGADGPLGDADAARLRALDPSARRHVDPSSQVSPAAVMEQAQVGPGCSLGAAVLRGAAVLPGTRVLDGERLDSVIACGDLRLGPE